MREDATWSPSTLPNDDDRSRPPRPLCWPNCSHTPAAQLWGTDPRLTLTDASAVQPGEQVDAVAVRIVHRGVTLTPERIPRVKMAVRASGNETSVSIVDLAR